MGQIVGRRQIARPLNDATEFHEHYDAIWASSIPGPSKGLLSFTRCSFALTPPLTPAALPAKSPPH